MTDKLTEEEVKLSREQSEQFAMDFDLMKIAIHRIDWDYARAAVKKLREQASFQDNALILNPGYPIGKTEVVKMQADALERFCQGVELLKKCDELKGKVATEQEQRSAIAKMFL